VLLTFPGLPPSILITLELTRSISGKCTRLDAMVDEVAVYFAMFMWLRES
jgi:hypothetical protein